MWIHNAAQITIILANSNQKKNEKSLLIYAAEAMWSNLNLVSPERHHTIKEKMDWLDYSSKVETATTTS